MTTPLTVNAREKSTYAITITFTDETGTTFTPVTATWTLGDKDGTTINSRVGEALTPATSITVVLQGDDLQIVDSDNDKEKRIFTVEGTYDSTNGSGLPFKESCYFYVENLKVV